MYLQPGSAAVELALGGQRLRPIPIALAADMYVLKIGRDVMSTAHVDAGANIDGDVGSDVDRDVTGSCFQIGVATLAAVIHQLHGDFASASFRRRGWYAIEFDAATTGFGVNMSFGGSQPNAASTGFNLSRTADIAEIDAAAAG